MSLSEPTLRLFVELLGQLQLPVSHPDFEAQAARVVQAKRELATELGADEADKE